MALTDLRNVVATINSIADFNNAIASYPDLASKLQATGVDDNNNILFNFNGVQLKTDTDILSGRDLLIDDENKIMVLRYWYYSWHNINLFCCYSDDKNYIIYCGSSLVLFKAIIGTNPIASLLMGAPTSPQLSGDTFYGNYLYTDEYVFKELVRYITTPTTTLNAEIKTDTKDMLIICGGDNTAGYNQCFCVQVDL